MERILVHRPAILGGLWMALSADGLHRCAGCMVLLTLDILGETALPNLMDLAGQLPPSLDKMLDRFGSASPLGLGLSVLA